MSMRRPNHYLTIEEHKQIAERLSTIDTELGHVFDTISKTGRRGVCNEAMWMRVRLRRLRDELKVLLYNEHGLLMARAGLYEPPWDPRANIPKWSGKTQPQITR